ncbi:uncharacterized protein LOC131207213 [Anopheles bellator]|uniref:uncharacterized protein LOC131207213 n=1 Tax=Anopheles bellator TaxID=139047 RepID=UPI002647E111|nr:uncharacterized protein LOC131207213 [Anopheles bellator]
MDRFSGSSRMAPLRFRREYGSLARMFDSELAELCERFESQRRRRHIIFYKRLRYKLKRNLDQHREDWIEILGGTLRQNIPTRTIWRVKRDDSWYREVFQDGDDDTLLATIRMNRNTYEYLVRLLQPDLAPNPHHPRTPLEPLSVEKQCAIALYKLATGESLEPVGRRFGVHKLTVSKCFHRFCCTLMRRLRRNVIRLPTEQESANAATWFEATTGLPRVMGLIGMTHIPIVNCTTDAADYKNAAGWPSIILQAVVDHRGRIRYATSSHNGSTDTYTVLEDSEVHDHLENSELPSDFYTDQCKEASVKPYLLGGREYPLLPRLITRYTLPITREEHLFNARIEKAMLAFYKAIERLKSRWQVLRRRIDTDIGTVPRTVICCCILHNMLERRSMPFDQQWLMENLDSMKRYSQPEPILPDRTVTLPEGEVIRDWAKLQLARRVFSSCRGKQ